MWPSLKLPPINLWNVPYMWKEKTIIDKIFDEELRYYIKMNRYAQVVYVGKNQWNAIKKELNYDEECNRFHGLDIVFVEREDYLRVG